MPKVLKYLFTLLPGFLALPIILHAQGTHDAGQIPDIVKSTIGASGSMDSRDFLNLQTQLRIIGFLALVSMIPFGVIMMTSFTRISIIFQFLRQALGSAQVPSNQIIIGLSLVLTAYVMHPVIEEVRDNAITPYMKGQFAKLPDVASGQTTAEHVLLESSWIPLRHFLLKHVREKDLMLFLDLGSIRLPDKDTSAVHQEYNLDAIPWYCLVPAFMISELRTAFMMGFLLFLPFLIIDMVVSSVLLSMGMMMLPPIMISTPFKLLLFVLVDGWHLIVQQVVRGFHTIG